jgi:hypothetical protein
MGKVVLFATPKVDPVRPWFPTESEIQRYGREEMRELQQIREISRQLDPSILKEIAVVASVLGMPELVELNADDARAALIDLTKRPDVGAVRDAYQQGKAAVALIRSEHSNPVEVPYE